MIDCRQAVVSPSVLATVYPSETIEGYSHEQFLTDLAAEAEKDIRLCLDKGAHSVQIDFTEAGFCMRNDPGGQLLREFIRFNNLILKKFDIEQQHRLGVHVCLGSIETFCLCFFF